MIDMVREPIGPTWDHWPSKKINVGCKVLGTMEEGKASREE